MASYLATPLEATRKHKLLSNLIETIGSKQDSIISDASPMSRNRDVTTNANPDQATRRERRFVKHALAKNYLSTPREKMAMFISMALPKDVQGNAGVIAKVLRELMDGPMKECSSDDEDCLQRAMAFLVSKEGKAWIQYWFLPDTTADVSISNKSGSHASTATSVRAVHSTVTRAHTATGPQLHERATSQNTQVPANYTGDGRLVVSFQTPPDNSCVQASTPLIAAIYPSAGQLSSTKQHKRSRSDPGQQPSHPLIFFCPVCHTLHCVMT